MSGGHFDYLNDQAANRIFGWGLYADYGPEGFQQAKSARRMNPLEDKQLSELCWDMFCLLHSYDWYASGDTGQEDYLEDVKYFKEKWLKPSNKQLVLREIEAALTETREDLCRSLLNTVPSDGVT